MNKKLLFILFILSAFMIGSCKSTPEETVVEEDTVPEEVVEDVIVEQGQVQTPVETPEQAAEPVSREEVQLARQALMRAEEVDASRFAPELMQQAYADLEKAVDLAEIDPEQARALLAGVKENADKAYELGKEGLIAEALKSMEKQDAALLEIEADKFSPEAYQAVMDQFEETRALIEQGDLMEARKAYGLSTLKAQNLHRHLSENIRWVKILERDTNTFLSDAEEAEAYIWAAKEFLEASDLLSQGMTNFRQYDLATSESVLKEAKFKARNAIYLAQTRKKQNETDQLLLQIQQELEEASTLMIQTEDGDIQEADPWSGSEYLNENPLMDVEAEGYEGEESSLLEYDLIKPLEENVEIVEEEEEELAGSRNGVLSLLDKAKALWQDGVKARNEGDYARSKELFAQAEAFIRAYRANAVGQTYTVQYKPEDRDCLWKIAGFSSTYGDPFLWPKIWQRNQKIIPNPDLIYPGQVLIIPPIEIQE